jgi:hypothetical protein
MGGFTVGIDPGASGSMVALRDGFWVSKIGLDTKHVTERDLADFLWNLRNASEATHVFVERVGPSRSQDGAGRVQGVSSTFKFGVSYGLVRGLVAGVGLPLYEIQPRSWQKHFNLLKRPGETLTEKKNRHKTVVQRMFPEDEITHATADALLIALYGKYLLVEGGLVGLSKRD